MGFLENEVLAGEVNLLLLEASPRVEQVFSDLLALGWRPVGELPTLLFGMALMCHYYEPSEIGEVEDSLTLAYARMMTHPVISGFLALKGVQMIDQAAGVNE